MDERICFPYKDDRQSMLKFVNNMTKVYEKMMDDISRELFVSRLLLSLVGNYTYMRNVVLNTIGGKKLNAILHKGDNLQYIYGAGIRGKRLVELFPDNNWGGFIDKNIDQGSYHSIKIMDLDQFMNIYKQGTAIIISNMQGVQDIRQSLLGMGILPEDVYVLSDFDLESAKGMYFPKDCIQTSVKKEKAFVDIGCYDGEDSLRYMKWVNDSKAKIYAFEPDISNYQVCREKLGKYSNIELFNVGLSDKEQEISVMGGGEMTYLGEGDQGKKIRTQLLDNVLQNCTIGYIKMDVEGHEIKVLKGAERIIREQYPVLAISLYHKRSDIWEIPQLLLEFNDEYCFYMRYYGAANGDTVLYAVDQKKN